VAEASDYFLSEDELRKRFEDRVLDYVFGRYKPQADPVLVLVGAQQAAGKSQAIARSRQRHADRQLVPLTGDALRFMHPRHDEIMRNEPWLFLEATGQATAHWVKWSIEHAQRENYSLILEGVFRDPQMPLATAEAFANSHLVEVVGLAVRQEVSRLDGEHRFLENGRWTPPELHDLSYRMMPETIRVLAGSPAVRRVTLTDRTGADLYVLDKTEHQSPVDADEVAGALVDLRSRPLSADEAQAWLARQRDTVITYAARDAIDSTSRPTLTRITGDDAARILPMAAPDQDSELRGAYEAAQSLLRVLVNDPLRPDLPLSLRTDDELRSLLAESGERADLANEAARRATLTPAQRDAENLIQRHLHRGLAQHQVNAPAPPTGIDQDAQASLDILAASNPPSAEPAARRQTSLEGPGRPNVPERAPERGLD
jgi:hypothetical protein